MQLKGKKITVTGGNGFLGQFVVDKLKKNGAEDILIPRSKTHDLREMKHCNSVVKGRDIVVHLAAKVGGIGFNQENPGELFYDNAIMGIQLLEAARQAQVGKFITVGTICAYPKITPVPFSEEKLWDGYPEETNAPYGLAKKILLVQGNAYRQQYDFNSIYLLPVNLYGPEDNFDPKSSHVIPALIKKIHDAQNSNQDYLDVWGTGKASREFLYVDDAAEGIVLATMKYNRADPVNLGSGKEITIKALVELLVELMKFEGEIRWDTSKPDGQPRRCLDTKRAEKEFGFVAQTDFREGLTKTIQWYQNNPFNK